MPVSHHAAFVSSLWTEKLPVTGNLSHHAYLGHASGGVSYSLHIFSLNSATCSIIKLSSFLNVIRAFKKARACYRRCSVAMVSLTLIDIAVCDTGHALITGSAHQTAPCISLGSELIKECIPQLAAELVRVTFRLWWQTRYVIKKLLLSVSVALTYHTHW